jgi:Peptidase family M28
MLIRQRSPDPCVRVPPPQGASPERLRRWVEHLAVPRHRHANASNNAWVRDELAAAFAACGLSVRLQGSFDNVVALPARSPRDAAKPLTLVAAHFDSVPDCPGADDNASGLAVMLECARLLRAAESSIGFVAFNAEEDGLLGSREFVATGLGELGAPLAAVHVLEMVGFRDPTATGSTPRLPLPWIPACVKVPDFISVVAAERPGSIVKDVLRSAAAPELRVVTARTWPMMRRCFPDLARSDHFPFWEAGLPAVMWSDTAEFRNPHYHRHTDTPETLDYALMQSVTEVLCDVLTKPASAALRR